MARVLVVEDDSLSQRLMRDVLSVHGYVAAVFDTAESGIADAAQHVPDLVLMDIRLPGMDGFAALRELRAMHATRTVPVVAVTASVMLGERQKIMDAGFDAYHPKPVQIPELLAQISSLLAVPPKSEV